MTGVSARIDLTEFITKELRPLGLPNFAVAARQEQFAWRRSGFRAWREGRLRFSECVCNLLPGRFKSAALRTKLQHFNDQEIDGIMRRAALADRGVLFGNSFGPTGSGVKNWQIALKLINEIVLEDEYQTRGRIVDDSIVIDAGANIGTFAVLAATLAPAGKVYAFEPTGSTFLALERNLRPYTNAVAVPSALGNRTGSAELLTRESFDAGNALVESGVSAELQQHYYNGAETVPITTIDAFVQKQNVPRVDFIKMDTEGFERQILEGAAETIKKYRPAMSLSAYHKPGDPERLKTLITGFCPEYRCVLKSSPELDLICDAR